MLRICLYVVFENITKTTSYSRILCTFSILLQYEPLHDSGNRVYMHHVIVYECHGSEAEFEGHARDRGHVCYQPSMPPLFFDCNNVVIAWGIGSEVSVGKSYVIKSCN